jgi:uncharacterized repeat protein (TIGR03803 family)
VILRIVRQRAAIASASKSGEISLVNVQTNAVKFGFGKRKPQITAALRMAVILLSSTLYLPAQTLTIIHTFNGTDGNYPNARLYRDSAGNLYGTTKAGGTGGLGTVFKVDPLGKYAVLHNFAGGPADGSTPSGGLVGDVAGNLYGTTVTGGATGGGTVFKVDASGNETVLHSFGANSSDGMWPYATPIREGKGYLYGTASTGGSHGGGIVYRLDSAGKETVLHSFSSNATDGNSPSAGLLLYKGVFYSTTSFGGTSNLGTIFALHGTKETVTFNFGGTAGEFPFAGLTKDPSGNLYGATQFGGDLSCNAASSGCGTVYKLDPAGQQTILYSFLGSPDGDDVVAGVVLDKLGNVYGTTVYGGTGSCQSTPFMGCGTIFAVNQNGQETVLYNFTGGADGAYPFGGIIRDNKGNSYGTAAQGGDNSCPGGCGTVFKLTP